MIEAVYIIKDSGLLFDSRESKSVRERHPDAFKDIVSAFFSAIDSFTKHEIGEEGIDHVQFKSGKCLYFKDFKIGNEKYVKLVLLVSGNNGKDIERVIASKSIELKWIIQDLSSYYDSSASLPRDIKDRMSDKMKELFS